ncbi:hypothetical protein L596_005669 [Steinernema carpocapsae]|uniref:protein-tyrosine-phosphatase n=1 Tax=Steinernema carpocapsae TaxID=34508 RepID=A0A4U8UZS7_STECR|nr:hypothetical protein L596_005669 [Steinernema carpocapsae]
MGKPSVTREQDIIHDYHLPKVEASQVQSSAFRSIAPNVLADLIRTLPEQEFATKYFLVDCRYPYEYFGGHIRNATNIFDPSVVENTFYPEDPTEADFMRSRIPIFYCEFSQKRGPTMGYKLREVDRMRNNDKYPRVDFPEIYLLDRGYSNFFVTPGCKVSDVVQLELREDVRRAAQRNAASDVLPSVEVPVASSNTGIPMQQCLPESHVDAVRNVRRAEPLLHR